MTKEIQCDCDLGPVGDGPFCSACGKRTRAEMARFNRRHRLQLPGGFWMQKDDENQWQIGRYERFLAFHLSSNVPCGPGGSFDAEAEDFAKAMSANQ